MIAMTLLFLYGTLKRGHRNHHFMAGQQFLGPARTLPRYRLYNVGPHPALVEDSANGIVVVGELWQVDDAALARLDAFEGAPQGPAEDAEFVRRPIEVAGQAGPVSGYFYCRDVSGLKDIGDRWAT